MDMYERIPDDEEKQQWGSTRLGKKGTITKLIIAVLCVLLAGYHIASPTPKTTTPVNAGPICPLPEKVVIKEHDAIQEILHDSKLHADYIDRFTKSIQVDTVVYDETTDYSKMSKFHEYLEDSFPLVYKHAEVSKVNDYGLVFHFQGSEKELKPIMLAAHQDTVPIGDSSDWEEDPFSGRFDGKLFHGRGSSDCKNLLVGLMEAMEKLLKDGKVDFKRGVVLAFGFDEEKSGWNGAYHIGQFLEKKFGSKSMEVVIDEGPGMFSELLGGYYALLASGEKGYADFKVQINTPGGHSSIPKDHTSIGMLSRFLTEYEDEMYKSVLTEENPMMGLFECVGEHGKLPDNLAKAARNVRSDPKARETVLEFADRDLLLKYNVRTSQAIDIINGGDKANSLPREVNAIINHRISYGNSLETVIEKLTRHANATVAKYGIGLSVNGVEIHPETEAGSMNITEFGHSLVPAKPTSTNDDFWFEFTGIIKSFYEDEVFPEKFTSGEKLVVSPAIMSGNTDTRHYWNLSERIFRAQPGSMSMLDAHIHGPNEITDLQSHLEVISFYYNFISHFAM